MSEAVFDSENLNLIEAVFEKWAYLNTQGEYYSSTWLGGTLNPKIKSYYKKYPKAKDRLVAILKNMIRNKGVFKLK